MPSQKLVFFFCITAIILYISSCIISEFDINTITSAEMKDCFKAYVTTNNPKSLEIEKLILGTWELDLSDQYHQVQFLSNSTYFVYDGDIITESGSFRIIESNNIFAIKTIPETVDVNGIINICSDHIFNETTNKIWRKRW